MGDKTLKALILLLALSVFGLCSFASFGYGFWETILAGSFNECSVTQNTISGEVGVFHLDDPFGIISHVTGDKINGYVLFSDTEGDNPLKSSLIGEPESGFVERELLFEFEITPFQENSTLQAVLSDEDDLDVLLLSVGKNGHWFVNSVDTGFSYYVDETYLVSMSLDVDDVTGTAFYSVYVENLAIPGSSILIDSGFAPNFNYGRMIDAGRIEKPDHTASGGFQIDNVLMQRIQVCEEPESQRQKKP